MDSPSAAAQVIVTIIPIAGIIAGSIVILTFIYFNHKQKIFMIEKGLYKKINFELDVFSLFTGMILLSIGLCLTVFFNIKEGISYSLLSGIVPLSCGAGLLIYYFLRKFLR
jgi:hypothetical protein